MSTLTPSKRRALDELASLTEIADGLEEEVSEKDMGGNAFPTIYPELASTEQGMTLRDYFAAKSMAHVCNYAELDYTSPQEVAAACYAFADGMLEARKS